MSPLKVNTKSPYYYKRNDQGFALIWLTLGVTALIGMGAVVIDIGLWYEHKAELQRVADNSALAGAEMLAEGKSTSEAVLKAQQVAQLNGYSLNNPADSSNPNADPNSGIHYPYEGQPSWFGVTIYTNDMPVFGNVFGRRTQRLEATGTAQYTSLVDAPISTQDAGYSGTDSNYSNFGLYAWRANGDRYSPMYTSTSTPSSIYDNGALQKNPDYIPEGYDFTIAIPSNYATVNPSSGNKNLVQVELFDPDCANTITPGSDASAIVKDANKNAISGAIDEIRNGQTGRTMDNTITDYKLVYTPTDKTKPDVVIGDASYGKDTATDLKWVTPPNFTFDSSLYTNGRVHLQVSSTDGSSENGFTLRAGPVHDVSTKTSMDPTTGSSRTYTLSSTSELAWNNAYKSICTVSAHGRVPLNFNKTGNVDIILGKVPANAKGGKFFVQRFDTDQSPTQTIVLTYTCDTLSSSSFTVKYASLDRTVCSNTLQTDEIDLPSSYSGGIWTAHYTAQSQDTSTWTLLATTPGDSSISLVGLDGQLH